MPIEFRTHGLDWKAVMRRQTCFCAQVTPAWHADPLAQRQYEYAQHLGIPIFLCVQAGTPLPANADAYAWRIWETPEELVALVKAIEDGRWT